MELLSAETVVAELRKIDGVISAELDGSLVRVKMSGRDWFAIRRRVGGWLSLSVTPIQVRYELINAEPCGAYDSMERAISSREYRPPGAKGFPPE